MDGRPDLTDASVAPAGIGSLAASYPASEYRLLRPVNRAGSVERYFHFILGFAAPILLSYDALPRGPGATTYLIRSCAIMDAHIIDLGLPGLQIVPQPAFAALRATKRYDIQHVFGFDWPEFYDASAFARLRATMLARLGIEDGEHGERVLIVDRGEPAAFYTSAESEVKNGSANLRRSVPNMPEVLSAIRAAGRDATMVTLEGASLADQVRAFAGSTTLIAQHGAALVNMLWMPKDSLVVEILPRSMDWLTALYFRSLAEACGHRYVVIPQAGMHGRVDPIWVQSALRQKTMRSTLVRHTFDQVR
jgi:hypothetical protein